MHHRLLLILGLLFAVILLVLLAQRIRVAYPIFLVIAGLVISLIPGMPVLHLDPELIFLLFLPPLLYEAAWYTSWKDFWKWRRPIALLAFGLVFFTSTVIAYASTSLIPGFTLALGFLLGGIVSPPDAVAAATVLKNMKVPKRLMTILEGESLVNDASSLIVFKFAVAAILSGAFSLQEATVQFFLVAGMGIVVGIAGALCMYAIHRFLPTTPAIDAALTLMTPYLLFLAAEHFHFSGVMAVVSGGLFMSYRAHEMFRTGSTRLNMLGVWNTLIFLLNAMVFILIGLELPEIVDGLGTYSKGEAIRYGLIITAITIALRYLWVYPAAHIPRWLSSNARKDPSPGWKGPLIVSWAGMRGVVSLATALSIPMWMADGTAFPQRNLILFITFVVIFVTLVFQGLTLPLVIRLIRLEKIDNVAEEEEQRVSIRLRLDRVALQLLEKKFSEQYASNPLRVNFKSELEQQISKIAEPEIKGYLNRTEKENLATYRKVRLEIFSRQRNELFSLKKDPFYSDEEIRKAEFRLDVEELKITGLHH
jgi:Na+/H+ antiporter